MTGDSLEGIIDFKVVDQHGQPIGSLHSLWSDPATGAVEFLGVKTGWLFGHNHVVPAEQAQLDETASAVRLPYPEAFIKAAPYISADAEISESEEARINQYYRGGAGNAAAAESVPSSEVSAGSALPLIEEPASGALGGARAMSESIAAASDMERWRRVGPTPAATEDGTGR